MYPLVCNNHSVDPCLPCVSSRERNRLGLEPLTKTLHVALHSKPLLLCGTCASLCYQYVACIHLVSTHLQRGSHVRPHETSSKGHPGLRIGGRYVLLSLSVTCTNGVSFVACNALFFRKPLDDVPGITRPPIGRCFLREQIVSTKKKACLHVREFILLRHARF